MLDIVLQVAGVSSPLLAFLGLMLRYLDNKRRAAAILAAPNDEAREKIASLPPLSLLLFLLLTTAVVSLVFAVVREQRVASRVRECRSDKDCEPPQKCRNHACTDVAEHPIALYYQVRTSPVGRFYRDQAF